MSDKVKILLIDDQEDDYIITRHRFAEMGVEHYVLEWTDEMPKALNLMISNTYDLYLLDYRLGQLTGMDLFEKAKSQGCVNPVILLTGQGDHQIDIEAMQRGLSDYLVKIDISAPLLERSIRFALERSKNLKELKKREDELKALVQFKTFTAELSSQCIHLKLDEYDDFLNQLVSRVGQLMEVDRCYISRFRAGHYLCEHFWKDQSVELENEFLKIIDEARCPELFERMKEETYLHYSHNLSVADIDEGLSNEMVSKGILAAAYIPLNLMNETIGFLGLENLTNDKVWNKDQLSLLKMIGEILSNALAKKRSEQELLAARKLATDSDRLKTNFLKQLNSELETPLNSIEGVLNLFGATSLDHEQKKYIDVLNVAGHELSNILKNISDFTSLEGKHESLRAVAFDLNEFLKNSIQEFQNLATHKNINLSYQIPETVDVNVIGDLDKIAQVLRHLLENATKFTLRGDIDVSVSEKEKSEKSMVYLFTVSDTGIGVSKEQSEKIFNSFVKGENEEKVKSGRGLGLTISKKLVELLGGNIWVESQEGQGSTFRFTVPLNKSVQNEKVSTDSKKDLKKQEIKKVLLVDDAKDMRQLVEIYLRMLNFSVDSVNNGEEAIEKVKQHTYSLILMDLRMPVMDGLTAVRHIRDWEESTGKKKSFIVVLTSYTSEDKIEEALDAGFDHYLKKPINKGSLENVIKSTEGEEPLVSNVVLIDSELKELIPNYLKKREEELQKMTGWLLSGNFDEIREIGHKIKGSGGGYGFRKLSEIGAVLEAASREKNTVSVQKELDKLSEFLRTVEIRYE